MPFRTIGNMYFGAGAFGDPAEAARQRMPSTLMDQYSQEELERMGRDVQSRLRNPFESRRAITEQFQNNLATDMGQRRDQRMQGVLSQFDQGQQGPRQQPTAPDMSQMRMRSQPTPDIGSMAMTRQPRGLLSGDPTSPQPQPGQGLMGITGSRQGQPQGDGAAEPPWARMARKGQSLLSAGFIEEGEKFIQNASRMADLPDWQQQQIEQEQNQQTRQQVHGALDALVEQGAISPERAALLRARPVNEIEDALFQQFSLSPGQQRYDALGNPVAASPTSSIQEFQFAQDNPDFYESQGAAEATAAMRNRENMINDYMHLYGHDRQTATAIADRQIETNVTDRGQVFTSSPLTGRFRQEDIERSPITLPEWTQAHGGREPTNMLEDAQTATGVAGMFQSLTNKAAGAAGLNEPYPATADYFNAMGRLKTDTIMRMGSAWPGRPSNFVIEQFEKLTFDPERLWQGDQQAVRDLETFTDLLNRDLAQTEDRYRDPRTTEDERAELAQKLRTLNDLRSSYDQALSLFRQDEKPPLATQTPASGQQGGMAPEEADAAIQRILGGQ